MIPNTLRYAAQQSGHFGKNAQTSEAKVPEIAETARADPLTEDRAGEEGTTLSRRTALARSTHFRLIPMDAFEAGGDTPHAIQDEKLDAVTIYK